MTGLSDIQFPYNTHLFIHRDSGSCLEINHIVNNDEVDGERVIDDPGRKPTHVNQSTLPLNMPSIGKPKRIIPQNGFV